MNKRLVMGRGNAGSAGYSGTPPVFAFEFNETSGTTLYDTGSSADGKTATINGTNQVLYDIGGGRRGIRFTTNNQGGVAVSGSYNVCPKDQLWSIEAYVYIETFGGYPTLFKFKSGTANQAFHVIGGQQGGIYCFQGAFSNGATNAGFAVDAYDLPVGEWLHLVMSKKGLGITYDNFDVWVNGEAKSLIAPSVWSNNLDETRFGNYIATGGVNYGFCGIMDYVRVRNEPLTADEVATLYANR